jgi:SAM-dependent methyltransferase
VLYQADPVAAYDSLAPQYAELSKRRAAYLRSVEASIVGRIPQGAESLFDLGAGDGARAQRIAQAANIGKVVLLEPSAEMSKAASQKLKVWAMRAEDLRVQVIPQRFDVITCLWNVLGHIPSIENRVRVLTTAAQLLSPTGQLFIDVIHRYNASSYGLLPSCVRWLKDELTHDYRNGDVTAQWNVEDAVISTYGHVFTGGEIAFLVKSAALRVQERLILDYETGNRHHFSWLGNLLYVLRRSS